MLPDKKSGDFADFMNLRKKTIVKSLFKMLHSQVFNL